MKEKKKSRCHPEYSVFNVTWRNGLNLVKGERSFPYLNSGKGGSLRKRGNVSQTKARPFRRKGENVNDARWLSRSSIAVERSNGRGPVFNIALPAILAILRKGKVRVGGGFAKN